MSLAGQNAKDAVVAINKMAAIAKCGFNFMGNSYRFMRGWNFAFYAIGIARLFGLVAGVHGSNHLFFDKKKHP